MSKGWYVKVDVPVQFNMDCNVGVVATDSTSAGVEAIKIVHSELKKTFDELRDAVPWSFQTGALNWERGCETLDPVWSELQAVSVAPDSDFDPEDTSVPDLMDAAMCLLEAFWNLKDDDLRKSDFLPNHGIAVVRDRMSVAANLCHQTWSIMVKLDEYDDCFDWDFCPRFLDNCMDDQMVLKSGKVHELRNMWKGD